MTVNIWRRQNERVPFTQVPSIALLRLSPDAYWLYAFLLEHGETVPGRIVDLRVDGRLHHTGLSRDRLQRALNELTAGGFYTYENERRSDGTVARVQWVTQVPGNLRPAEPSRTPSRRPGTRVSRENAHSRTPDSVRRAKTSAEKDVPAGQHRIRRQSPDSVRPAETVPGDDVFAGQHRIRPQAPDSVRPAETVPGDDVFAGQHRIRPQAPDSVRPAETGSLDGLYAGQDGFGDARASSFRETDRQTTPLPPKADVPVQRGSDEGEEPAPQPQDAYLDWAWKLLEGIDGVPMRRNGSRKATVLAAAVAERLAAGRPEQEIRDRIRAHIPQQGIIDTYAFALRRVEAIPLRPPGEGRTRESDRAFGETAAKFDALGLPLYARPRDNPDAVDVQAAGGWRELVARKINTDPEEGPHGAPGR